MDFYSNGQTRYNNLLNQMYNPNMNQDDLEAFQIGASLGNIGGAAMNKFGKADGTFGGIDVSKGAGGTDLAKFGNLTNGGTDFSKLNLTDPNKMKELTDLYNKAKL